MADVSVCAIEDPDVTVVLKNQSIPFRWELLTNASPVFESLSRWTQNKVIISLDFLSETEDIVLLLLDYIRTGIHPTIDSCLIEEMLHVCDMLYIEDLGDFIKATLMNIPLTLENCFDILFTCSLYNVYHVILDKFIKGHLNELTDNKRMVRLTYDSLLSLLQDELLSYWSVEKRLTLILEWCNADNVRAVLAEILLDAIDITRVDQRVLVGLNSYNSYFLLAKAFESLKVQERICTGGINDDIPVVYLLDKMLHGQTLFAFNVETSQFMRVSFPTEMPVPICIKTVRKDGRIVCVPSGESDELHTIIHQFNPSTNLYERHKIMTVPEDVNDIFEADQQLFIISTKHHNSICRWRNQFANASAWGVPSTTRSTIYKCVQEEGDVLEVEPLFSFAFEVCYIQSFKHSLYFYRPKSALYCFSLSTCTLESISGDCIREFGTSTTIVEHNKDTMVLSGANVYHVCVNNEGKQMKKIGLLMPFNFINDYVSVSDRVVRFTNDSFIRLYQHEPQKDILQEHNWTMIKVPQIISKIGIYSNTATWKLALGFIKRTEPVCHYLCPHCDPDAEEEEEMLQLQPDRHSHYFPDELDYSDRDDYDYCDDYYDSDNGWNEPEYYWDASADEMVEVWW